MLGDFSARTRARGHDYARRGHVLSLEASATELRAMVAGTHLYPTRWSWTPDLGWDCECGCPLEIDCKHAYAAAVVAIERFGSRRRAPPAGRPPDASRPAANGARGRGVRASPVPSASSRELKALEELRGARSVWQARAALERLLGPSVPLPWDLALVPWLAQAVADPDPELRCFRVARGIQERNEAALPAVLAVYVGRADLAERLAERERGELLEAVLEWAERRAAGPARQLRVAVALVEAEDGPCVEIEARVSSTRLRDAARTLSQLEQLRSECQRTPGLLAGDERALLELLVRHRAAPSYAGERGRASPSFLARLLERFDGSALVAWDAALPAALAAQLGVAPETPVRLARDVVRIVPDLVAKREEPHLELVVSWPDGRRRPLAEALLLPPGVAGADPGLVLADGAFHVLGESPPQPLVERFAARGSLPLRVAELPTALQRLVARHPHLRQSTAAWTRHHRVTPLLQVDLLEDEWLELRLLAHDGPPGTEPGELRERTTRIFEWLPERGWERRTGEAESGAGPAAAEPAGPERTHAGLWLEGPEPGDVDAAADWAAGLAADANAGRSPRLPAAPPARTGLRIRATAKDLDRFAEAWERRPEALRVFATLPARRLLDPGLRVVPRLSVAGSGIDFFEVSAAWEAEGLSLSEQELARLRAATTRFVRLGSGWVRREVVADLDAALGALADLGIEPGDPPQRVSLWQLAGAKPESLETLERLAATPELAAAARELRRRVAGFRSLPEAALPAGLGAALRPYQRRGLDFLAYTSTLGLGAILADDMGLGKTVQALAWILRLREDGARGPVLVVCPTSVVHNWVREAERFAPALRVLVLERGAERHRMRAEISRFDLVVTNYALLRRDAEEWGRAELLAAILDEAQQIKNPDAEVTRAAKRLRARHRLALTGTPLENRALDLWSLMGFVNPGYLGSRDAFAARYDAPDAPPERRRLLAAKLRPVLLRRLKQEVAPELPERIEERRDCELLAGQRKLYLAELRKSRRLIDALDGDARARSRGRIAVLAALTRLRQICCHPALADGGPKLGSGKFEALFELLEPLLAEGHKVLVFSQFVACLRLLRRELVRRGIACHELTGATRGRARVVADFQEDARPCVFLVSLRAGGTGLNLTAANYVVLFDPWWNPAVEAQAIDRTHRIGQDRTVIAYRLLAAGTIEEKIFELQQRKSALTREILGEAALGRSLTREDLAYLFAES
jgi:superfamily II DNA or RNA helicase